MLPRRAAGVLNNAGNMLDKLLPAGQGPEQNWIKGAANPRGGIFGLISGRQAPTSTKIGQHLTKRGQHLGSMFAKFGQSWPDLGQHWSNNGRFLSMLASGVVDDVSEV